MLPKKLSDLNFWPLLVPLAASVLLTGEAVALSYQLEEETTHLESQLGGELERREELEKRFVELKLELELKLERRIEVLEQRRVEMERRIEVLERPEVLEQRRVELELKLERLIEELEQRRVELERPEELQLLIIVELERRIEVLERRIEELELKWRIEEQPPRITQQNPTIGGRGGCLTDQRICLVEQENRLEEQRRRIGLQSGPSETFPTTSVLIAPGVVAGLLIYGSRRRRALRLGNALILQKGQIDGLLLRPEDWESLLGGLLDQRIEDRKAGKSRQEIKRREAKDVAIFYVNKTGAKAAKIIRYLV